jgi:hypothetical protein
VGDAVRWIRLYYGLTPVFAVADWLFGAPVRAAAFASEPGLRAVYYGMCLACLGVLYLRPAWSTAVILTESSANLLLLVLSVFLPYYAMAEQALNGQLLHNPFDTVFALNFLLAGGVWVAVFQSVTAGATWGGARELPRFTRVRLPKDL